MTEAATIGLSGSHHAHSKLSPSSAACWTVCTAMPAACEADYDEIFKSKILKVWRLTSYLESLGDEMYDHERRAIKLAEDYLTASNKGVGEAFIAGMTEQDRKDIEHSEGSEASRFGTRCHDWAAKVLLGKCKLDDVPEAVHHTVKVYTDYCFSLIQPDMEVIIEESVPLYYYDHTILDGANKTGTVDCALLKSAEIDIIDLKAGSGKLVNAQDNKQLAVYGYSFVVDLNATGLYNFGPETIINITIVQPNHHADLPVKTWSITLADLEEFCKPIGYAAIQIQEGNRRIDEWIGEQLFYDPATLIPNLGEIAPALKFCPGTETCQWCDRKKWCGPRAEWVTGPWNTADASGFDNLTELPELTKDTKKLTPMDRISRSGFVSEEAMVAILDKEDEIVALLSDIREHLTNKAMMGVPAKDTKLVEGRQGNRAWRNEEEAAKFLKNQKLKESERYNFKLKSPAQVEEILEEKLAKSPKTQKLFESHIVRSAGRPTLVLDRDNRPAISPANGFDDETTNGII